VSSAAGRTPVIHLIQPPVWPGLIPPLSLARLKGYLAAREIPTVSYDWNLDYYYQVGTPIAVRAMSGERLRPAGAGFFDRVRSSLGRPSVSAQVLARIGPPAANAHVIEYLEGKRSATQLVGPTLEGFLEESIDHAVAAGQFRGDDIYGFSLTAYTQVPAALVAARALRRRYPTCCVVLGGPVLLFFTDHEIEDLCRVAGVDRAVRGPGEQPLDEIYRAVTGRVPANAGAVRLRFDGLPLERYLHRGGAPLQLRRQCYWAKCRYCHFRDPWAPDHPALIHETLEELERLVGEGFSHFGFCDEALEPHVMSELAAALIDRGLTISWAGGIRPERRFLELDWQQQRRSGRTFMDVGLESGSERMLRLMKRGTRRADVPVILEGASRAGIRVGVTVMFGFPGEEPADAEQTLSMLEECRAAIALVSPSTYHVTRGSDVSADPAAYGISLLPPERFSFTGLVPFVFRERHAERMRQAVTMSELVQQRFPQTVRPTIVATPGPRA
jgi:hypothetical protein